MVEGLKESNADDVRIVYRHFPLITIHDKAQIASEASEAAGAQGKFWEMHNILYERQQEWSSIPKDNIVDTLVGYANTIEVSDLDQFRSDLENEVYAAKVLADYDAAVAAGLGGTPSFAINQLDYPTQQLGLSFEALSLFAKMATLKSEGNWQ